MSTPKVQASDYNSTTSPAVCAPMIIGQTLNLCVSRTDPDTIWLEHDDVGEIPLSFEDSPDAKPGDTLRVFIYSDSQANPVATTRTPAVFPEQCACLKVRSVTELGAFLEWGIAKDLFLPFNEQRRPVQEGAKECVMVYVDNSGRLAASSRLDKHLPDNDQGFKAWQAVSLLIYQRTDLGFKAVIDNRAIGLLYKDEVFTTVKVGQRVKGFVKRLRADHRIDLALQPPGEQVKDDISNDILQHLNEHHGVSTLTDKSAPELIYDTFGVSKKNFKRALSSLYKRRIISIEPDRIVLVDNTKSKRG